MENCGFGRRIWSHLLKKSLMENFIFCAVYNVMINGRELSNQPVKNNLTTYNNIRKIATSQRDD